MPETIDVLIRARTPLGDKPFLIDATSRIGYAVDATTGSWPPDSCRRAWPRQPGRFDHAERVRWAQIALALTRIGAVLVPLSTLLTGPELIAQLRVASVRYLIAVAEFRGHHYLDDLHSHMAKLSALQTIWRADELPAPGDATVVDAVADTVVPADPLLVMFTSGQQRDAQGVIHSHGNALAAVRRAVGAPHRRRHPTASRCRSSGSADSVPGC